MPTMFEPKNRSNANDPYLINPRGIKVQVPEERVAILLKNGYILFDPNWEPNSSITNETVTRTEPLPLNDLKKEISKTTDILEVIEI